MYKLTFLVICDEAAGMLDKDHISKQCSTKESVPCDNSLLILIHVMYVWWREYLQGATDCTPARNERDQGMSEIADR